MACARSLGGNIHLTLACARCHFYLSRWTNGVRTHGGDATSLLADVAPRVACGAGSVDSMAATKYYYWDLALCFANL